VTDSAVHQQGVFGERKTRQSNCFGVAELWTWFGTASATNLKLLAARLHTTQADVQRKNKLKTI
jgi:hypothetical protein